MTEVKSFSREKEMSSLSKLYLTLYNGIQSVGWSYILFQTVKFLIVNKSAVGLWQQCSWSALIFQSLAVLEVVHCIVKLVPSNVVVTAVQVASRLYQVWAIIYQVEKVQNAPSLGVMLIAWSLTEVIRYSFYTMSLIGKCPSFLTWCRYTFFMALYPAGAFGEFCNILVALDTIKRTRLFSLILPNPLNISFSFYYSNILLLISYFPLFPQMFKHMLRQRRKVLGPKHEERENENEKKIT